MKETRGHLIPRGTRVCKVFLRHDLYYVTFYVGVMLRGDMKLVVGSYSVLRRRHDKRQTVFLYNVTEDSNELFDLRYFQITIT